MTLNDIYALLAMAPRPSEGQESAPAWMQFVPLILIFFIFYLVLIRPQQKKAREHAELIKTLKSGDKVVTNGGIIGVIVSVKDKTVSLRSADSKLELSKSYVSEVTERAGNANANAKES